jgi:hypothetical protein
LARVRAREAPMLFAEQPVMRMVLGLGGGIGDFD